jgi:hypothetical protein
VTVRLYRFDVGCDVAFKYFFLKEKREEYAYRLSLSSGTVGVEIQWVVNLEFL